MRSPLLRRTPSAQLWALSSDSRWKRYSKVDERSELVTTEARPLLPTAGEPDVTFYVENPEYA
jgi:hypothetical protein